MYTKATYIFQVGISSILLTFYFFLLGKLFRRILCIQENYDSIVGFIAYAGIICPVLFYLESYSAVKIVLVVLPLGAIIQLILLSLRDRKQIGSIFQRFDKPKLAQVVVLLSIWLLNLFLIGTKPVPPGGDTLGHVLLLTNMEEVIKDSQFFKPYLGFYTLVYFTSKLFYLPLHACYLGFQLVLYNFYLLSAAMISEVLFKSKLVGLFSALIGLLVVAPFKFLYGTGSHLWGVVVLLDASILWLLTYEEHRSVKRYLSAAICAIMIIYNYVSVWPIFLILVITHNAFQATKNTTNEDTKLFRWLIWGTLLSTPFMYNFYISIGSKYQNPLYIFGPLILVVGSYILVLGFDRMWLAIGTLRAKVKIDWLPYIYLGLVIISVVLTAVASTLTEFRHGKVNIFFSYGIIIFGLSLYGNFLISNRYRNLAWIVGFCCVLMFIYDVTYLIWMVNKSEVMWMVIKQIFNRNGVYILGLILSSAAVSKWFVGDYDDASICRAYIN